MLGWALSAVIIVSLVAVGFGALSVPRRWAALYGIVLDDPRALAFVRAMGVRDLVIGGLIAVIAFQRRREALGWGLCLAAVVALVDYVVVTADRRLPDRRRMRWTRACSTRPAPSASCWRGACSSRATDSARRSGRCRPDGRSHHVQRVLPKPYSSATLSWRMR
jgi:hypothetical protein